MNIIPIENKSDQTLRVMLEPLTSEYDILPKEKIEIRCNSLELQIDFWSDGFLSIWVPADAEVLRDGKLAEQAS